MLNWITNTVNELARLPGVAEVVAADDAGGYLAGVNNPDPDEFAAVVAFTGRSAMTTGEILAMDELRTVSLMGKKHKLLVYNLPPVMLGVRLTETAIVSKLESRIQEMLPASIDDVDEEDL